MKEYFVYILQCADHSYYTGFCNNLERRMAEHEEGIDSKCYTYKRRPVKLVYAEVCGDVWQTIAREKQIKGWRRAKKQALIEENWEKLVRLSQRKSDQETS